MVRSLTISFCLFAGIVMIGLALGVAIAFAQDHKPTVPELQGALGVAQQQLARSTQDALALGAQLGGAQAAIEQLTKDKATLCVALKAAGKEDSSLCTPQPSPSPSPSR